MEPDPRDIRERKELLEKNRVLTEKIRRCNEQLKGYKKLLDQNKKDLEIFNNPAYGPSFVARNGRSVSMTSEREEERMITRIKHLPITSTPSFQINKKLIASNHKCNPRSLEFAPKDGYTFVTTCKGGRFNLWDSSSSKDDPSIIGTINASANNKKWADDVAFFPEGDSLIAAYKSPDYDEQIAIVTFDRQNGDGNSVRFLQYVNKRGLRIKGGIRRVVFPEGNRFITAGEDRSIFIWRLGNPVTTTLCHNTYHTNDINGLCRLQTRPVVVSGGLDKRVVGYDYSRQKVDSFHYINDPCLAIVPNPVNPNLMLIQTN